jgi:hypothetical protein
MLKEAREFREAGKTFVGIAAELNAHGYRNRAGKPIIESQIYQWIERARGRKPKKSKSERIREGLAKRKEQGLPLGNPHLREISKRGTATIKARAAAYLEEVMPIVEKSVPPIPIAPASLVGFASLHSAYSRLPMTMAALLWLGTGICHISAGLT